MRLEKRGPPRTVSPHKPQGGAQPAAQHARRPDALATPELPLTALYVNTPAWTIPQPRAVAHKPCPSRVWVQDASRRGSAGRITSRPSCSSAAWTAAPARPKRGAHPRPPAPRATAPPCGPVADLDMIKITAGAETRQTGQHLNLPKTHLRFLLELSSSLPPNMNIVCLPAPY